MQSFRAHHVFRISGLLFLATLTGANVQAADGMLVVKSEPDECYNGLGEPYQPYLGEGSCGEDSIAKRNQTYGWALTSHGTDLWIGTGANVSCLGATAGAIFSGEIPSFEAAPNCLDGGGPCLTVCEGPESQFLYERFPLPVPLIERLADSFLGIIGDWRPPEVWVHDTSSGVANQERIAIDDTSLQSTLGLRGAGAHDGVVLMGGPTITGIGLQMFAFDADTKEFIGSRTYLRYSNVRRFVSYRNDLYLGVQKTGGGGAVLRWTGNRSDPFDFVTVGEIDNEVAYLAVYEHRLVASTWVPSPLSSAAGLLGANEPSPPGIWMSPRIPFYGLRAWHADRWRKVWDLSDYEPDPVIAASGGIGDLHQFGGCLYFGTMHPPYVSYQAITAAYGDSVDDPDEAMTKSRRTLAIFRSCDLASWLKSPTFEVLYGEDQLPVFSPGDGEWQDTETGMGPPRYGRSGFQNDFGEPLFENLIQIYTWSMGILDGQLCVGTQENAHSLTGGAALNGGDLWCFPDNWSPAYLANGEGLGNTGNSGFRNIERVGDSLYVATSNGENINDGNQIPMLPAGGFEVIRVDEIVPSEPE